MKLVLSNIDGDNEIAQEILRANTTLWEDFKVLVKYEGVRNSAEKNYFPELYSVSKDARFYWRLHMLLTEDENKILRNVDGPQPVKGMFYK